jgi:membrane protease YdiL (CAAX protease family)
MTETKTEIQPTTEDKVEHPKNVIRWNPLLAVLAVVVIYFLAQIIGDLIVSVYPLAKHWSNGKANNWLQNSVIAQFFYVLIAEAVTVSSIFGFLKLYKVNFSAIGLHKPRWRDPLYGIAIAPVFYVAYFLVVFIVKQFAHGLNVNQQQQIGFTTVHGALDMILTFVSLVILPPLAEEIMFRGFLYGSLKKSIPKVFAAVITSLIFASAHLPEGGSAGPLWIAAIDTFILSLFLLFLREKTKNLWAGMTLHAFNNGIAFATLFILTNR